MTTTTLPFTPEPEIKPHVVPFFDDVSNTFSYVISDPSTNACAIIDSVMDLDYASGSVCFDSANEIIQFIKEKELKLEWIIETHVHADHMSAAPYLQQELGGKIGIGSNITLIQHTFGKIFNEGTEFERDGSQFDQLFVDGDHYQIGNITAHVLHTPGHTPACMTHVIGDAAFVGDTLFMPDGGTARCDFPGGCPRQLFQSIKRILSLPEQTRLFMCHDYGPNGREIEYETTVADERQHNIHVHDGITEDTFVEMRLTRDATLSMPKLILPSLQVNMRGGHLPPASNNGQIFLKIPINAFN